MECYNPSYMCDGEVLQGISVCSLNYDNHIRLALCTHSHPNALVSANDEASQSYGCRNLIVRNLVSHHLLLGGRLRLNSS